MPAWFGVSASILVGLFAAECSGRKSAGAFAALIMAIVPAHIMRSVAGGLDPRVATRPAQRPAVKGFVPSTPHRRTRRPSRDHRSCPLSTSRHQSSGGFDNESVATTALVATFYCWVRALRDRPTARDGEATADSYAFGLLCGIAYVYMVAAWGGRVRVPLVAGWLTAPSHGCVGFGVARVLIINRLYEYLVPIVTARFRRGAGTCLWST